jgi:hypothetical protein
MCIRGASLSRGYAFMSFVELPFENSCFCVVAATVTDGANARYPRLNRRLLLGLQHR